MPGEVPVSPECVTLYTWFSKNRGQIKGLGNFQWEHIWVVATYSLRSQRNKYWGFFIYNPSSELCIQTSIKSGDRKKESNQELHLKPCYPTFGPKKQNRSSDPKLPFTQPHSPIGFPPQCLLVTPPYLSGNAVGENVQLICAYGDEILASLIWTKWPWRPLNIPVLHSRMASNGKYALTQTRCKTWTKFCSEPHSIKE